MKFVSISRWFWVVRTLDIKYIVQFAISFFKYWFALWVVWFDDYLDYLEISRFRMWNFATSFEPSADEASLFSGKVNSAINSFASKTFFSKIRVEPNEFPDVRGFTWDRGESIDSLESRLVLGEYYLSYEKDMPFNNFQTYMLDNRSIYYSFRRTEYDYESYIPGLTYKSRLIVCSNKFFIRFIFLLCFFVFFIFFLLFEIIYLFGWLIAIRMFKQLSVYNKFVKNFIYLLSRFWIFFIMSFSFILKPALYCGYLLSVFLFFILYLMNDFVLLVYTLFSSYLYRFWFTYFNSKNGFEQNANSVDLKYLIFKAYINIYKVFLFFFTVNKVCSKYFFTKFVFRIVFSISFSWMLYFIFYSLFFSPIFQVFFIVFFDWVMVGCYFFFFGSFISPICIFILCILFPYVRKFIATHKYTRLGKQSTSYSDARFIKQMNLVFYAELSREPASFRLSKWPLRREVNDLKRMMDHEISSKKNIYEKDQTYNSKLALKKKFNSTSEKFYHLAKLVSKSVGVLSSKEFDSSFAKKSMTFSEIETVVKSASKFRYDSLEFKLYQRELSHFYFVLSNEDVHLGSLVYRSVYYYKNRKEAFLCRFPERLPGFFQRRYGVNGQIPNFVFKSINRNLYAFRIFSFFELTLDYYYYITRPIVYPHSRDRCNFDRAVDLDPADYVPKIFNDESSVNWSFGLESYKNNFYWDHLSRSNPTFGLRGTLKFSSWFNFPSVVDDPGFQDKLDNEVADNTFNYQSTTTYIQKFRDIDWVIRLNSNIFLSYSFVSDFYSNGIFPIWVFKNFFFELLEYPNYQEIFSSWVNHFIFSGHYAYSNTQSNNFFDYVSNIDFKNFNYYYRLLDYFNFSTNEIGLGLDSRSDGSSFSKGIRHWSFNVKNSTEYMKSQLSSQVADYLYVGTNAIDTKGYNLLRQIEMDYKSQSSHISQLHTITSTGMQRYIFTEEQKEKGNIWFDLANLFKVFLTPNSDDRKLLSFKGVKIKHKGKELDLDDLSKLDNKRLTAIKLGHWTFPSIRPNVIFQLIGIFIINSYICVNPFMGGREGLEFWFFFNHFFLFIFI